MTLQFLIRLQPSSVARWQTLAPGAPDNTTFTGTYIITQADIDAGTFTNTATANSLEDATDDDSDTQPLAQNSGLTLVKVASPQTYSAASQTINYQFQFTNSGNVTLHAPFTVTDDKDPAASCPGTPTSLAPGESITCTGSYIITQSDVDAGSVTNTASGTAQDPGGQTVTSNDDSETVTAVGTGALVLVKTATPQTYNAVGDVIDYSYLLTNGTNVTLSPPYTITDDKSIDENCPAVPDSLAPGGTVTCTASYTITQGIWMRFRDQRGQRHPRRTRHQDRRRQPVTSIRRFGDGHSSRCGWHADPGENRHPADLWRRR